MYVKFVIYGTKERWISVLTLSKRPNVASLSAHMFLYEACAIGFRICGRFRYLVQQIKFDIYQGPIINNRVFGFDESTSIGEMPKYSNCSVISCRFL